MAGARALGSGVGALGTGVRCAGGVRRAARTGAGARPRRTWVCCWAVGYALGALSLFLTRFDSVLFLSQFLDIVREPGS